MAIHCLKHKKGNHRVHSYCWEWLWNEMNECRHRPAGRRGEGALQGVPGWREGEESGPGQHQERDHHPAQGDGVPMWPHPQGRKSHILNSVKNITQSKTNWEWGRHFAQSAVVDCRWRSTGSSCSRPRWCRFPSTTRACVRTPSCTSRASDTSTLSGTSPLTRLAWSPTPLTRPQCKAQGVWMQRRLCVRLSKPDCNWVKASKLWWCRGGTILLAKTVSTIVAST